VKGEANRRPTPRGGPGTTGQARLCVRCKAAARGATADRRCQVGTKQTTTGQAWAHGDARVRKQGCPQQQPCQGPTRNNAQCADVACRLSLRSFAHLCYAPTLMCTTREARGGQLSSPHERQPPSTKRRPPPHTDLDQRSAEQQRSVCLRSVCGLPLAACGLWWHPQTALVVAPAVDTMAVRRRGGSNS
jgi:hypothetical protein